MTAGHSAGDRAGARGGAPKAVRSHCGDGWPGLEDLSGRPKWRRTKPDQIATDLVHRAFARKGPDQLWVTDITEHPARGGKVCWCVVLDAYSSRVVGWSIDPTQTVTLVTSRVAMTD
ncbi:DDE-type integrase/transposase/recombinase [Nonomuraea bangladeshensis]|uniref:DDE-type integrase/transposase/recombinase n=1 Tax=Nonomuraea bangladeshensis TaxID=404385 RepID=UPI0031DB8EFB